MYNLLSRATEFLVGRVSGDEQGKETLRKEGASAREEASDGANVSESFKLELAQSQGRVGIQILCAASARVELIPSRR
jgi:hypothetical protein